MQVASFRSVLCQKINHHCRRCFSSSASVISAAKRPMVTSRSSNNPGSFTTLLERVTFEREIKKSKFIAIAGPISDERSAQSFLSEVRDPRATHNCWAYKQSIEQSIKEEKRREESSSIVVAFVCSLPQKAMETIIAEVLVTAGTEIIVKKMISLATEDSSRAKLEDTLDKIEDVLGDAEARTVRRLKGVADKAEGVLDEIADEIHGLKVEIRDQMKKKFMQW